LYYTFLGRGLAICNVSILWPEHTSARLGLGLKGLIGNDRLDNTLIAFKNIGRYSWRQSRQCQVCRCRLSV